MINPWVHAGRLLEAEDNVRTVVPLSMDEIRLVYNILKDLVDGGSPRMSDKDEIKFTKEILKKLRAHLARSNPGVYPPTEEGTTHGR